MYIDFDQDAVTGSIKVPDDVPLHVWNQLRSTAVGVQPDAVVGSRAINLEWRNLLAIAPEISHLRRRFALAITYSDAAKAQLLRFREETLAVRRIAGTVTATISEADVPRELLERGFTKRQLTQQQIRDVAKMVSLSHGANFSVPGAGKTTVAFAVHILAAAPGTRLLVVAPKNAFSSWDDVVRDTLGEAPGVDTAPFTRLSGSRMDISNMLLNANPPNRLLISYEQLTRSLPFVTAFLNRHPVHVILDESHRIKAGGQSQRGATALAIGPLAVRRDILSGTPIPNTIQDIVPQIDFLWPGQELGTAAATNGRPQAVLGNFYVRTTKNELGLGPIERSFIPVMMSEPQVALYGLVRDELLKRTAGVRLDSNVNLESSRRSVMRLLQIASNPLLVVKRLTYENPESFNYDDETVRAVFGAIVAERDSPKIREACRIARELAQQGERTVIWSTFTETVERVAELLTQLGATFIHGGIDAGAADDPTTREGRIREFHDESKSCMVLVANPAACSEGISLHKACHNAVYIDRSFNAVHYLQSVDRIHRLGLPPGVVSRIHVLESVSPQSIGSIDYSVRRRLIAKLQTMSSALNDIDLQRLMMDEDQADAPVDADIQLVDILDVIRELRGEAGDPMLDELT